MGADLRAACRAERDQTMRRSSCLATRSALQPDLLPWSQAAFSVPYHPLTYARSVWSVPCRCARLAGRMCLENLIGVLLSRKLRKSVLILCTKPDCMQFQPQHNTYLEFSSFLPISGSITSHYSTLSMLSAFILHCSISSGLHSGTEHWNCFAWF